jgi:riboflavin kinase/FMN adenylyltransferase
LAATGAGSSETMKVVHSLDGVSPSASSVVTIGNFDGVHRGHRAILTQVSERARQLGASAVAITLDPHPLCRIAPERAPVAISTLEQKVALIGGSPIDLLLVQEFDEEFRELTPNAFIKTFLVDALGARCVCVGQNFRFGHKHSGNLETLKAFSNDLEIVEVPGVFHHDVPISSSLIRILVVDGKVGTAGEMLGRCYEIEGKIVGGAGRGRRVTVPTLNLDSVNPLIPMTGVYLTRISVDGSPFQDAVTNVGVRPTFDGDGDNRGQSIETHVLHRRIGPRADCAKLRFVKRLRDEIRFDDSDQLRQQIEHDVDVAARFFSRLARDHSAAV